MTQHFHRIPLICIMILWGCKVYKSPSYSWGKFNIKAGYEFVNLVDTLSSLQQISLIDTKADGNEFKVNKQPIFLDTSQIDMPNFYSYIKRAKEINIEPTTLLAALRTFYQMGVNEYRRKESYFLFPVVTNAFAPERGYFYDKSINAKEADTVQTRQGGHDYKIVLVKQIEKKWFEYQEMTN